MISSESLLPDRRLALAAIAAAALALPGCGNDVDDAGAEWPRRDVKIMAPADPGGGWDTTAREMPQVDAGRGSLIGQVASRSTTSPAPAARSAWRSSPPSARARPTR